MGRGEEKAPPVAPQSDGDGIETPELLVRGLCHCAPTAPIGAPGATAGALRRYGKVTTSSSSATRADEPSGALGLGERRDGEAAPDPDPEPESVVVVGRAMGAMGRVIGPGSGAAADTRRPEIAPPGAADDGPAPGARIVLAEAGVIMPSGPPIARPIFEGGPIGAAGAKPLPKPWSKGVPGPTP